MKFVRLIDLKLLTIANSSLLNIAEHEVFSAYKYEKANKSWHFHIYFRMAYITKTLFKKQILFLLAARRKIRLQG